MAENTSIEWCDHTFNPWIGCTKVSPGCDNCYAEARMDTRLHRASWGAGQPRSRTKTWGDPVRWNKAHEAFYATHGRRQRVFCASLADVFDNEVDPQWRADLFELIGETPNLDWLLLTKRIGNAARMMEEARTALQLWGAEVSPFPWRNVWLGATIVNQEEADRDIPKLLATPARVRFLSCEPLLGDLDVRKWLGGTDIIREHGSRGRVTDRKRHGIDWVIGGGESGPGARPMHPDWVRSLRDQCQAAGVPFMFKQHGEHLPVETEITASEGAIVYALDGFGELRDGRHTVVKAHGQQFARVGKKAAGRLLDGVEHNGFPKGG